MKLSIITPSLNQKSYVDSMLSSVKTQSISPFEHLIYDGGSSDGTLAVLKEYERLNKYVRLVVGADSGQAHAINMGFGNAKGEILTWLNTDDFYIDDNVIKNVLLCFEKNPGVDIVYGRGDFISEKGKFLRKAYINKDPINLKNRFITSIGILQPALFLKKSVFNDIGPLDEKMDFSFDYEYWVRALFLGKKFKYIDSNICNATIHVNAKTMRSRVSSLNDCAAVCNKYYGFTSFEWVDRITGCELSGADGIIQKTKKRDDAFRAHFDECFSRMNTNMKSVENIFGYAHMSEVRKTIESIKELQGIDTTRCIVTTFDSYYFSQGLTMVSGVHNFHSTKIPIIIYNLGLDEKQIQFLSLLKNVFVVAYPKKDFFFYEKYFDPKSYGYKCLAMWHIKHILCKGELVLWIDAGVYPTEALDPIFDKISNEHVFFIDHDDKSNEAILNISCTSDECCDALNASNRELMGVQLRSSLMGYKISGRFDELFDEAFRYSLEPSAVLGDKHPVSSVRRLNKTHINRLYKSVLNKVDRSNIVTLSELRKVFAYYGHRQDQSIFSILASRYCAPLSSARRYCLSCNDSSIASKKNWESGSVSNEVFPLNAIPTFYKKNPSVTIQHRGTYISYCNLRYMNNFINKPAIILGNGPSLKGFEFSKLHSFDTFGMNAAYRFWDKINWYPKFYSCLDTVVGESHASEIQRLIEKSDEYGIELFLLREELVDKLKNIVNSHKIVNFDILRVGVKSLASEPITTGSHTTAWASILGYNEIYLLGIDCNYIEIVAGVKKGRGNELVVSEECENPNYFFEDYQRLGDKFNIPNPSKDLHIRSWKNVADNLRLTDSIVMNANPKSKVDVFDFCAFEDILIHGHTKKIITGVSSGDNAKVGYLRYHCANIDESHLIAQLFKIANFKKSIMIDVGAHHGFSLAPFHEMGWRILAYEPDLVNRSRLMAKYGNKKNILIDASAVGEHADTKVNFYRSKVSTGISGMLAFHKSHKLVEPVNVTTITEIIDSNNIENVSFLKIDVEGFDFSVLKGIPWKKLRPDVIECEFEDAKTKRLGHSWKDICKFLVEKGYTVYVSEWHPIIRYGIRHDWLGLKSYPCSLEDANAWGNLLAFKNDPGVLAIQDAVSHTVSTKQYNNRPKYSTIFNRINNKITKIYERNQTLFKSMNSMLNGKVISKWRVPYLYSNFAEWLKRKNPTLFGLGQFVMWVARIFVRRPVASVVSLFTVILLIGLSKNITEFNVYENIISNFVAGLVLLVFALLVASFGNKKKREFVEYVDRLKQSMKTEILQEILNKPDQIAAQIKMQGNYLIERGKALDLKYDQLAVSSPILNFSDYQHFNRRLTETHVDILLKTWTQKLNQELTAKSLAYIAHRICTLDCNLRGRLATTIEDAVLRVLVASAVDSKDLRVLEIGTLFGIGLSMIYDYTRHRYNSVHLTAIDPLEGYYKKDISDIVTGEIVNEEIFHANLSSAGVLRNEYTLLKSMSTDESTIQFVTKMKYDVLIIDGDHEYKGVKSDFENYFSCINVGGYIIFDDYNSPDWPDVTKFVDTIIQNNSNVKFVGQCWRTAIFQVLGGDKVQN